MRNSETLCNLETLFGHLSKERCTELSALVNEYLCLVIDVPTRTHLIEHDIDAQPVHQHFYRVSEEKRRVMEREIKYKLDNNIAEPSSSSWASPWLLVDKADKSPKGTFVQIIAR